jgi:hypothetical protein
MTQSEFDANTRSIAERKVKGTLADRQQKFGYKLADLHSQFVKAGGTGGSAQQQVIRDACGTELRERFQAVWEILRSVAVDFNLPRSTTTGEELKRLMREHVLGSTSDLRQAIQLTKGRSVLADGQGDVAALVGQVLPEAEADIDLFVTKRATASRGQQVAIDSRRVFMSHAAIDAAVAILLKEEVERRPPGVSVFCSSYPGHIPLGFRWSPEIQRNLQQAGTLILVATTRSIQRNWVWFESGAFWFDRPIVICCLGELRPDSLPPPLGERQATTLATADDLKLLFEQLSGITGVAVADAAALDSLANRLAELERNAQSQSGAEQGWVGVAWEGKFLVCGGPLEPLSLIESEYYQESMNAVLTAAGFSTKLIRRDHIGEFKDRGIKPIYVTDKKTWRKKVEKGDVILVAEPPTKS